MPAVETIAAVAGAGNQAAPLSPPRPIATTIEVKPKEAIGSKSSMKSAIMTIVPTTTGQGVIQSRPIEKTTILDVIQPKPIETQTTTSPAIIQSKPIETQTTTSRAIIQPKPIETQTTTSRAIIHPKPIETTTSHDAIPPRPTTVAHDPVVANPTSTTATEKESQTTVTSKIPRPIVRPERPDPDHQSTSESTTTTDAIKTTTVAVKEPLSVATASSQLLSSTQHESVPTIESKSITTKPTGTSATTTTTKSMVILPPPLTRETTTLLSSVTSTSSFETMATTTTTTHDLVPFIGSISSMTTTATPSATLIATTKRPTTTTTNNNSSTSTTMVIHGATAETTSKTTTQSTTTTKNIPLGISASHTITHSKPTTTVPISTATTTSRPPTTTISTTTTKIIPIKTRSKAKIKIKTIIYTTRTTTISATTTILPTKTITKSTTTTTTIPSGTQTGQHLWCDQGIVCDANASCIMTEYQTYGGKKSYPECVCNAGYYGQNGRGCVAVDCTPCPEGFYLTNSCTERDNRICKACTPNSACLKVRNNCTATSNLLCKVCQGNKAGSQCHLNVLAVTTEKAYNQLAPNITSWVNNLAIAAGGTRFDAQAINVTTSDPVVAYVGFVPPYDYFFLQAVASGSPAIDMLGVSKAQAYDSPPIFNPRDEIHPPIPVRETKFEKVNVVYVVIGVCLFLALLIGFIIFFCLRYRRKVRREKAQLNESPILKSESEKVAKMVSPTPMGGWVSLNSVGTNSMQYGSHSNGSQSSSPSIFHGGSRPLPGIPDPRNALDAMFRETVRQQDGPIAPNSFVKLHLLGEGAFGSVYQGALKDGDRLCPVAVKQMKPSNSVGLDTFRAEAALMKRLSHPNIVLCIGATASAPLYIILELMPLGDLSGYFQKNQKTKLIGPCERVWYAYQIARGMNYLTSKGIVHRDLAARNCMLSEPVGSVGYPVCKISDFGLSREVDGDHDYYRMESQGKVPVPWLAIETLKERKFNEKTDVWAYGVTLWEIYTNCSELPYAASGISLFTLVASLDSGYRLPQPEICPLNVYNVVTSCWHRDPTERPTFASISDKTADMFVATSPFPVCKQYEDGETIISEVLDHQGYVAMDQYEHFSRLNNIADVYENSPYIKPFFEREEETPYDLPIVENMPMALRRDRDRYRG